MSLQYLKRRELYGGSSRSPSSGVPLKRVDFSFLLKEFKNFHTDEYSTVDTDGHCVPPLACSFAKVFQHQHVLGVVDEDGYLVVYNTHKTGRAAVTNTWQVHNNAVFDLEWMQTENKMLTASGDQTVALHDVQTCTKLDTFRGHFSSVKSVSSKVGDDAVFASGSRDGHIMIWDMRITHKDGVIPPVNSIYNAHTLQQRNATPGKMRKKYPSPAPKDAQQSVTSVLFQTENLVISAGAVDGCVKVWDIRKTYKVRQSGVVPLHVFPYAGTNSRKHGYTSLSLDSKKLRLFASCTDDIIYEYDMASYRPDPVGCFQGHKNSTFYVKTALSPDDQFLMSGSSDDHAYIWQVNEPERPPVLLKSHTAEVTGVAWCPNDLTKLVTMSDDTKIKFWRVYCRELRNSQLPEFYGKAKVTANIKKGPVQTKLVVPTTEQKQSNTSSSNPPSSSSSSSRQKTTSSANSPQSCIKTWLWRSKSMQQTNSEQHSISSKQPAVIEKTLNIQSQESSHQSQQLSSHKSLVDKPSCDSSVLSSHTLVKSMSCPSGVPAKPEQSSLLSNKRKSPPVSPSKRKHEAENVSPLKSKHKLDTESTTVSSPKRQCLTRIEGNVKVSHVRVDLFGSADRSATTVHSKIDSVDTCITSGLGYDNTKTSSCTFLSPVTSKQCKSDPEEGSDRTTDAGDCTPTKLVNSHTHLQADQFDSPTQNLPNLVMDELTNPQSPTCRRAKDGLTTKSDWLTQFRLGKLKKSSSDPVGKQTTVLSPKQSTKGCVKISSFFKPRDS